MLIANPDLINSCRVCRSPNQDGDYESLYQSSKNHEENQELSEAGILYENLLDISLSAHNYYPQFLCNSCDLQMKLFKKLKDKAYKTLEYLQSLCDDIDTGKEHSQQVALEDYAYLKNCKNDGAYESQEPQREAEEYEENEFEIYRKNGTYEYEKCIEESEEYLVCEENIEFSDIHKIIEKEYQGNADNGCEVDRLHAFNIDTEEKLERKSSYKEEEISHTSIAQEELDIGSLANKFILRIEPTANMTQDSIDSEENMRNLRIKFEEIIDKNDYVTEIYELLDDESQTETYSDINENLLEYDLQMENTASISEFNDIEYIIDDNMDSVQSDANIQEIPNTNRVKRRRSIKGRKGNVTSTTRKREYKCIPCQLEFENLQEHKLHRTQVHNERYPCNVCSKELKSAPALCHHMKMHNGQPAYQCEICQKTFNQKAHYQYHMNVHNNVRDFKCNLCEKAFISKTDLKVHLRLHTGQRPYVCNVCGKDYLMMEHLKTHLLSHTGQSFECDICNNKFATHKTLRLHVQTIHIDEPRFKCTFCLKPFRRKHHLESHLRLHQKNENFLDIGYEMVDDPDFVSNEIDLVDVVEQDIIDNPGFIALSDYIM